MKVKGANIEQNGPGRVGRSGRGGEWVGRREGGSTKGAKKEKNQWRGGGGGREGVKLLWEPRSMLMCLMFETRPAPSLRYTWPPAGWSWIEGDLRKTWSLRGNLTVPFNLRSGLWNVHHFPARGPPSHCVFEHEFLTRPNLSVPQCLWPWCLLSRYLPQNNAYPRKIPGRTFITNWWSLDLSLAEIGWYSIINPKGITGPVNGSPKRHSWSVFPSGERSWTSRR